MLIPMTSSLIFIILARFTALNMNSFEPRDSAASPASTTHILMNSSFFPPDDCSSEPGSFNPARIEVMV